MKQMWWLQPQSHGTASQPATNWERQLSWTLQHLPVDSHWWHHHDYIGHIKPNTSAQGARGWEVWGYKLEMPRNVRKEEGNDRGGGGIEWPLGHSLQLHRDRTDSQVSRSHTCMSKIYCWVVQLMTPSWGLTLTWPAWRTVSFLEHEQHQRQENKGKREGRRVLLSMLVCAVFSVALYTHWAWMSWVCIRLWVRACSMLCNHDRIVRMSLCVL